MRDPLGGIKGDEIKKSNPFAVDRLNALKELDTSIDWIEGRKRKSDKSVLQRMRDGTWGQEEKSRIGNRLQTASLMALMLFCAGLEKRSRAFEISVKKKPKWRCLASKPF